MKQCEGCGYNMSCTDKVDGRMGELHEECAVADDMTPEQTEACNQGQCPCRRPLVAESHDYETDEKNTSEDDICTNNAKNELK